MWGGRERGREEREGEREGAIRGAAGAPGGWAEGRGAGWWRRGRRVTSHPSTSKSHPSHIRVKSESRPSQVRVYPSLVRGASARRRRSLPRGNDHPSQTHGPRVAGNDHPSHFRTSKSEPPGGCDSDDRAPIRVTSAPPGRLGLHCRVTTGSRPGRVWVASGDRSALWPGLVRFRDSDKNRTRLGRDSDLTRTLLGRYFYTTGR